jgi:SPX domain protein involved in polyphosphate accumulation
VVHLKSRIIRHMPILVYGRKSKHLKAAPDILDEGQLLNAKDSERISSVYLDNASLQSYHSRLLQEEGAHLFRVRWCAIYQSLPNLSESLFF